jgi:transcriptional regulator with XRE-family HTH domain
MQTDLDKLGQLLAIHRKRNNYTLEQLSAETGIGVSTLSEMERGLKWPRLGNVKKLSAVYGVSFMVESTPAYRPASLIDFLGSTEIDDDLIDILEELGRRRARPVRTVADWARLYESLREMLDE